MNDFIFPTKEQIYGENGVGQLEVFKKYGTKCAITDFTILLGGFFSDNYYVNNSQDLKDRTGWWWSASPIDYRTVRVAGSVGSLVWSCCHKRSGAARPASLYSDILEIHSNEVRDNKGITEIEYGEYPQYAVNKKTSENLELEFENNRIKKTGKSYTTDSVAYDSYNTEFQAFQHIEYEYKGRKYVRVKANTCYDGKEITLSNGEKYRDGDFVWVEVQPIKWLVDKKTKIAISKNALFAGVQFNFNIYDGDFSNTDIKKFMDTCFSKDIIRDTSILPIKKEFNLDDIDETLKTIKALDYSSKLSILEYGIEFQESFKQAIDLFCDAIVNNINTSTTDKTENKPFRERLSLIKNKFSKTAIKDNAVTITNTRIESEAEAIKNNIRHYEGLYNYLKNQYMSGLRVHINNIDEAINSGLMHEDFTYVAELRKHTFLVQAQMCIQTVLILENQIKNSIFLHHKLSENSGTKLPFHKIHTVLNISLGRQDDINKENDSIVSVLPKLIENNKAESVKLFNQLGQSIMISDDELDSDLLTTYGFNVETKTR